MTLSQNARAVSDRQKEFAWGATVGLRQSDIDCCQDALIEQCDDAGVHEDFAHRYPHMLVMGYDNQWTPSQRNAVALLFCFGHAVALAKQLHGVSINSWSSLAQLLRY